MEALYQVEWKEAKKRVFSLEKTLRKTLWKAGHGLGQATEGTLERAWIFSTRINGTVEDLPNEDLILCQGWEKGYISPWKRLKRRIFRASGTHVLEAQRTYQSRIKESNYDDMHLEWRIERLNAQRVYLVNNKGTFYEEEEFPDIIDKCEITFSFRDQQGFLDSFFSDYDCEEFKISFAGGDVWLPAQLRVTNEESNKDVIAVIPRLINMYKGYQYH